MIDLPDTVFDEATDGLISITPGTYPAHVQAFDSRAIETKMGSQKVFNVTFQVADEVKSLKVERVSSNSSGELEAIVDEKGNIRDARLNDYVKTWVENAALIGILKAQGKVTSKIFKDGEKTIEQIKKSYDKTKDKAQNDAYADLLSRTE